MNHVVGHNQLTLLRSGAAYFPQLIADIELAEHAVYLESYIFAADQTGHQIHHALVRAAARGVMVQVLLDGFGSANFPARWQAELTAAGAHFQWYRRERFRFKLRRHRLRRLHRKLVAIDHDIAFIGGINILDDQSHPHSAPRFDYAVRIQGAMANEIRTTMRQLWQRVAWIKRGNELLWQQCKPHLPSLTVPISLLLRDNVRHRRDIERAYLHAITHAQHEIILANAYFLPGRAFRRALKQAAKRGVRVVLLLQGKVEYPVQHYATHALYDQLLSAGIEIYEYQRSYLHAKVAVIDENWTTIGSSNIDPFSLLLAREANIVIQHADFASELRDSLLHATQYATRIQAKDWQQANWAARLLSWCSYSAIRTLVGIVGYKRFN
jgi:cardiolipin synthase